MNSINIGTASAGSNLGLFKHNRVLSSSRHSLARSTYSASSANMAAAMVSSQQGKSAGEAVDDHHPKLPKVDDPVVLRTCTVDEAFRRMEELVGSEEEEKNWKGIVIALLVIAFILGMIALAIVLVTPAADVYEPGAPMLFSMLTDKNYQLRQPTFSWVKGTNKHALYVEQPTGAGDGSIERYVRLTNAANGSQSTVVPQDVISSIGGEVQGVEVSPDSSYALMELNSETNYITKKSTYIIYDTLAHNEKRLGTGKLQYATWTGQGHGLVYVQKNNIYYQRSPTEEATNVTKDGTATVLNGLPDKLYKAYIRPDSDNLIWPSPINSRFLFVYAKVDVSTVQSYSSSDTPTALGKEHSMTVSTRLFVFPGDSRELHLPSSKGYITAVTWMDADRVLVVWLNADQHLEQHIICNCSSLRCQVNYEFKGTGGVRWVGLYGSPIYNAARGEYYTILPDPDQRQYYRHIAAIKVNRLKPKLTYLTSHPFDDVKILGLYKSELIYLSTGYNYTQQHIYSVNLPDTISRCLTCEGLSALTSNNVGYVEGDISPEGSAIYLSILGPSFPTYYVVNTESLLTGEITGMQIDESHHSSLISAYQHIHLPKIQYLTVGLDGDVEASVKLIRPPIFDEKRDCLYETLLIVNDLPGARTATQKFSLGFQEYLAKNQSYIIALVDVRGSGGRGERVRQAIYDGLGSADSYDIIKVIEFLREENKTTKVDGDNMAVLGRNYGGFVTLHAASRGGFNCAVVTSPITSLYKHEWWLRKRFMNTTDVALMYECDESSRSCSIPKIDELLVVHGITDAVVTVDNSLELMKELQMTDYTFRQQLYPDVGSHLENTDVASHYYQTVTNFLYECFKVESRIDNSKVNYCENREFGTK